MRVLITTVKEASVEVFDKKVAAIGHGLLLLVGFTDGDDEEICRKMAEKVINLRIFADEHMMTNLSICDVKGDLLSVSQFTLYADASKGRRPSFVQAMSPNQAQNLYEYFNQQLELLYRPVSTGIFGAYMKVYSINDGPFTIMLDSKDLKL